MAIGIVMLSARAPATGTEVRPEPPIYWQAMASGRSPRDLDDTIEGDAGTRLHLFPRPAANARTGHGDPVIHLLDALDCSRGGAIYVAMGYFTDGRQGVAEKLAERKRRGCDVRVIVAPQNLGGRIEALLEEAEVELVRFPPVHSKYMLLDGLVDGARRRLVFTGSHNFTAPALEANDETFLQIEAPRVLDAFLEDFWRMVEHPLANCGPESTEVACPFERPEVTAPFTSSGSSCHAAR